MQESISRLISATLALGVCGACAGPAKTLTLASYLATSGESGASFKGLEPGTKLVLHAPAGSCRVSMASSLGELEQGKGKPVAGTPAGKGLSVLAIKQAYVRTGSDAFAAIEVSAVGGESHWLALPAGASHECLQPVPAGLEEARQLVGKKLTFAPWMPTCTEVQAAGRAPAAMLIDAEGDLELEVGGLTLGPAGAQAKAAGKLGNHVWTTLAGGSLEVRADVIGKCFAAPGSELGARPKDPLSYLRLPTTRCEEDTDDDKRHVACRTTLGLWEGVTTDSAVELRAVRRTIGPVHFLDGRLIDGARYARTIVAVSVGQAPDPRRQRLYSALTPAMQKAMARDAGGVRVTTSGASDATYEIGVELAEVTIGELQTSELPQTTKYKVRDEQRPNPDKPAARERAANARTRLSTAESDYQNRKQEFDRLKREARAECDRVAAEQKEAWARIAAGTGCAAADALIQPSDSDVVAARTELSTAETELARMPDTITVPIMADWQYTKKQYSRSVTSTLSISLKAADAPAPKTFQTPLQYTWQDYEVGADAAHNVQGHSPDRGPIDNPEALVPYIADAASAAIATRFRAAMADAQIEAARRAMAAAGIEASKPGYETVDALAFDTVGKRLEKPLMRGASTLGAGKTVPLPAFGVSLSADQCLLVVAAGTAESPLTLAIRSGDHQFADSREGGFAIVELCRSEIGGKVPALELTSKAPGDVKWTLFRTRVAAPGGGS